MRLLFHAREKVLNNFKSRLFPIKNLDKISIRESTPQPTPELAKKQTNHKNSKLKLRHELLNEIIVDKKNVNDEIF